LTGFADIMAEQILGPVGNERYRGYAADIRGAGRYMLTLVNNLLDLAKIEAGRLELDEEPCDLDVLIGTTVSMIRQRAGQAGVVLEIVPSDDVPRIRGDAILIRQMLTNLLTNAVKFCKPEGGRVSVGIGPDLDGGATLTVMDNGVGMAPDQIPQALAPFGQVRNRPAHAERGTGLGLSLTKALIELHGGSIGLDSRPGDGTTIRLRFPPERVI
jgi:two-component system, cell cycle sensor histidine kinase PleC